MKQLWKCIPLVLLLGMTACVPTPETEIVSYHAGNEWESIVYATAMPDSMSEFAAETQGSIDSPKNEVLTETRPETESIDWRESFSVNAAMDKIHIEVDVSVEYPKSGTAPVAIVGLDLPDETQTHALIACFLGDGPLYVADRTQTKSYYQATMERCTAALETETDESMRRQWELLLERTAKQYADAPEDTVPDLWDGHTEGGVDLMTPNGDGSYRYLSISATGVSYRETLDAPQYIQRTIHFEPKTEREQAALRDAQAVLQAVGVDAELYALSGQEQTVRAFGEVTHENAVALWFHPIRNGYPCMNIDAFTGYDGVRPEEDEPAYAPSYPQERLQIVIEDGKVLTYRHEYPSVLHSIENSAAQLLAFETIQARFCEWVGRSIYVADGDPLYVQLHTVRLTMRRIPQRDGGESLTEQTFWLTPVWEFIGSVHSEKDKSNSPFLQNRSILRINALDGSVL